MYEASFLGRTSEKSEVAMNDRDVTTILSERDEQLLVRYFDGEHSWIDSLRAKLLLKTSPEAREFVETLTAIGEIARNERAGILSQNPNPVDLWSKISSRIEEEERAALYLGGRVDPKAASTTEASKDAWYSLDRFVWGLSGGALAACLTYLMIQTTVPQAATLSLVSSAPNLAPAANINRVRAVSYNPRSSTRRVNRVQDPRPISVASNRGPGVVEVDWVKSDGRVQMMQDPAERSAVIWVKRREPMSFAFHNVSSGKEPLVVYGDRVPQTIQVSNSR
jgi:hypothetical protein